jgi:hypothetical protein
MALAPGNNRVTYYPVGRFDKNQFSIYLRSYIMRFAVIGDIHSNLAALESVLIDIENKNVDFILCTGDLVGYAPFPN